MFKQRKLRTNALYKRKKQNKRIMRWSLEAIILVLSLTWAVENLTLVPRTHVEAKESPVTVSKAVSGITEPKTLKEHVWGIMVDEYGLSFDEAQRGMAIVGCESHWNKMAINKNTNGTYDLGLWQINEVHTEIDREQMFDVYAATRYAMELHKKQGFTPWVCNKLI